MTATIALTGAAGRVGSLVRPVLAAAGYRVILLDVARPELELASRETFVAASILDRPTLERVLPGCDLVVHLAGYPQERPWADIAELNINGTQVLLEAARSSGVCRVLLASSIHAVGMLRVSDVRGVLEPTPHPDCYYGVTKAAMELLGRVYGDRLGMIVVSARLGTVLSEPCDRRSLETWLSPGDLVRMMTAVLALKQPGGHVIWGISHNSRAPMSLVAGQAIGYHPIDDAEHFAEALGSPLPQPEDTLLGAGFADGSLPVGVNW